VAERTSRRVGFDVMREAYDLSVRSNAEKMQYGECGGTRPNQKNGRDGKRGIHSAPR
jgi:hypothetical protein